MGTSSLDSKNSKKGDDTSRLSCLISHVIESNRDESSEMCTQLVPDSMRQKVVFHSPFEYFSKLQAMSQTVHYGALSHFRHNSAMMQISHKDFLGCRSVPTFRFSKAENTARGNPKKYRCDVCDKTFSRSNTLITHKVTNAITWVW
ncbi:hypothetical protein NECAME_09891 [Necator americanus]|uniref:C2H2-type domain-containing protein n=1 Tax=Necator americanus TaxID=51031 RepID=W2TCL5_NECAM|nr:hypothetical protein NECAME_09891 [Necator americanus]ETN79334.1 hypothetical protein NECAME_09891 [Necator americanus]